MTEDFIKNQEAMIENFESALKDKYPSGSVPTKAALVDFLTEFFPVKSEERMEEVLEALDEQCEGPGAIVYSELWEENRQGDQVSCLKINVFTFAHNVMIFSLVGPICRNSPRS